MKWLLLVFVSSQALAYYNPYQVKENERPVCDDSYLELTNTPPLREQGSIGICYAFSSLLLLEHLKCSEEKNPSQCYASNRASPIDMAKYLRTKGENEIIIGGDPQTVLARFSSDKKLVNEACASMNNWKQLGYQPDYEDYFHQIHNAIINGATQTEIQCFAQDLSGANLGEVSHLIHTLSQAKNLTLGQLRAEILYKKNCTAPDITFPAYQTHSYPTRNEKKTNQGILNFVKNNLDINSPVEVSFCAEKNDQGKCFYHSATITGMRNICSGNQCHVQYKIQNSYGRAWQEIYDDGWVNSTLINESIINTPGLDLNSVTRAGRPLPKTASYIAHTSRPNVMGNCENQNSMSTTTTTVTFEPQASQRPVIYQCRDHDNRLHYSDKPLTGMFCKAQ